MNRLQSEQQRLYLPPDPGAGGPQTAAEERRLIDADGQVRAMVLALARPADWEALSKVWQGVQLDLALPAPAIAVAGADGYQLWFSLAEPVAASQALAFLESLRRHYLSDILATRIGLLPTLDATSALAAVHARLVPAALPGSEHWSAFVSPDLAPVFAEEPWLDSPPNPVGQSDLLSRLECIAAADFHRVLERLQPATTAPLSNTTAGSAGLAGAAFEVMPGGSAPAGKWLDPKRFLLEIMNNDSVALNLRIDAAKALLPYFENLDHH